MTHEAREPHPRDQAHPINQDAVIIEHDPHATLPPGPIDRRAWSAGVGGILLGLLVALCFVVAASAVGS
jgi:hypothetical protein